MSTQTSLESGVLQPGTQRRFPGEQVFVEIAEREPSFAGAFLDGPFLVAALTDPDRQESVRGEVERLLLEDVQRRGRGQAGIETRIVEFSFYELANWRNAVLELFRLDDVYSIDLDEAANRVDIGLIDGSGETEVTAALDSLGIPAAARLVEVSGGAAPAVETNWAPPRRVPMIALPTSDTIIAGRIRPIPGGVSFKFINSSLSVDSRCTTGFNARDPSGTVYIITASHCTGLLFYADGTTTWQFQAFPDDTIGFESIDPTGWVCGARPCRYSDAAAYEYSPSFSSDSIDFGTIARPEGPPGTGSTAGSIRIDDSQPQPRFDITGVVSWPMQNDSVHKVGWVGGWTKGKISETCTTKDFSANGHVPAFTVECSYRADYRADFGDSGGPVFFLTGSNTVSLAGMNFAKKSGGTDGIFASFGAVFNSDDLLTQWQVWNDALSGNITGPTEAPDGVSCTWSATSIDGVWPFSYQWSGALSGSGVTVSGTINDPGEWLKLTVTDGLSNQLTDSIYIPVDDGLEECEY